MVLNQIYLCVGELSEAGWGLIEGQLLLATSQEPGILHELSLRWQSVRYGWLLNKVARLA